MFSKRSTRPSLSARAALTALALAAAAGSSHAAVESFTSGTSFFKRVITNTSVNTTSATVFADVPGTLTTIFVPGQTTVLVSVDYSAEAACSGGGANNPNWCELMVMIGGVEGSPQASTTSTGDTYSFAATDNGAASPFSWRGHAMSRHRCIRNTSNAPLAVPVSVQWKLVNFTPPAGPATTFWLDDSATVVQMSTGCTVVAVPAAANIGPATESRGQTAQ